MQDLSDFKCFLESTIFEYTDRARPGSSVPLTDRAAVR